MRMVQPGALIARKYVVERVIGRGGVGIIAAARHVALKQLVALKFLRPEIEGDPEVTHRFLREAQAAAQIRSEHVTRVMDAGALEDGTVFLVFEYLAGRDLAAVLREDGPLPIADAVDYLMQACEAIAEAHAHGIIHRDLKPANLFLTRSPDGAPFVKVLDFGLSKFNRSASATALTADNHVIGSPHFMSPEQMRSSREADARSDVWALGVVLFGLLTGRVPFEGEFLTEVCAAVLAGKPRSLVALRPEVPPELEAVILRCLRTNPAERTQSVSELADALRPFNPTHGRARAERIARVVSGTLRALEAGPSGVAALLPAPGATEPAPAGTRAESVRDPVGHGSSPVSWSISVGHARSLRTADAPSFSALDDTRAVAEPLPRVPALSPESVVPALSPETAAPAGVPSAKGRRYALAAAAVLSLVVGGGGAWWVERGAARAAATAPSVPSASVAAPSAVPAPLASAAPPRRAPEGSQTPVVEPVATPIPIPMPSAAPPAREAPRSKAVRAPTPKAPRNLVRPTPLPEPPRTASDEELILGLPH